MTVTLVEHERIVHFVSIDNRYVVSEKSSLAQMKEQCPLFFETSHGERETFAVHRGQLIVRHTAEFDGVKERKTVVYLFLQTSLDDAKHEMPDLFHAGRPWSITDAKRRIDCLLDEGKYTFGEG